MAMGSANSLSPYLVTHATSGEKPLKRKQRMIDVVALVYRLLLVRFSMVS